MFTSAIEAWGRVEWGADAIDIFLSANTTEQRPSPLRRCCYPK